MRHPPLRRRVEEPSKIHFEDFATVLESWGHSAGNSRRSTAFPNAFGRSGHPLTIHIDGMDSFGRRVSSATNTSVWCYAVSFLCPRHLLCSSGGISIQASPTTRSSRASTAWTWLGRRVRRVTPAAVAVDPLPSDRRRAVGASEVGFLTGEGVEQGGPLMKVPHQWWEGRFLKGMMIEPSSSGSSPVPIQ